MHSAVERENTNTTLFQKDCYLGKTEKTQILPCINTNSAQDKLVTFFMFLKIKEQTTHI